MPEDLAVPLPDHLGDELGASLGIPGITAHRTVFGDGPGGREDRAGARSARRGRLPAAQLARLGGATVLATVRRGDDLDRVDPAVVSHAVALDSADPAAAIRRYTPRGVDRIIEVALSRQRRPGHRRRRDGRGHRRLRHPRRPHRRPFWPLLFNNVTLRLLGSDDFPAAARRQAARDLTAAAAVGALTVDVGDRYPLEDIAQAHDRVDAGGGRVLVTIPHRPSPTERSTVTGPHPVAKAYAVYAVIDEAYAVDASLPEAERSAPTAGDADRLRDLLGRRRRGRRRRAARADQGSGVRPRALFTVLTLGMRSAAANSPRSCSPWAPRSRSD